LKKYIIRIKTVIEIGLILRKMQKYRRLFSYKKGKNMRRKSKIKKVRKKKKESQVKPQRMTENSKKEN